MNKQTATGNRHETSAYQAAGVRPRLGHRPLGRVASIAVAALCALCACGAPKAKPKVAMEAIGVDTGTTDGEHGAVDRAADPLLGAKARIAKCTTGDTEDIEAILRTNTCVTNPSPDSIIGKIEVKVTAPTDEIVRGGRIDFGLTIRNITRETVILYMERMSALTVEVQVFDAQGKRADTPTGRGYPPDTPEVVAIHLLAGATITVAVPWDAAKRRFSDDGASIVTGAPLPKGNYSLRFRPAFAAGIDKSDTFAPRLPIKVTP